MNAQKSIAKKIALCALFVAFITAGGFVRIPAPLVPITLQMPFALLGGVLLGGGWGVVAVLIYIAMGVIGLPVFANGGGAAYVLQPTFGYLIGIALAAFVVGVWTKRSKTNGFWELFSVCLVGTAVVYAVGAAYCGCMLYFYWGEPTELWNLLIQCCLLPLPKDLLFAALTAFVAQKALPILRKLI